MDATWDALAELEDQPLEHDPDAALARVWLALSGDLDNAAGDVRALNRVLREHFEVMRVARVDGQPMTYPATGCGRSCEAKRRRRPTPSCARWAPSSTTESPPCWSK